jgi:hypothetical protein
LESRFSLPPKAKIVVRIANVNARANIVYATVHKIKT